MLPASFARDGFITPSALRGKRRRLMVGTEGPADSGKTEFSLSAPGPGIVLCLDRGFDAVLDNQNPPASRREDFAFKVITVPMATQVTQPTFVEYWKAFYNEYKKALDNPDARTVVLDGDSDSWELQRLAEFGKLTKVPPIAYDTVNAARRAMYARAWDSGKIVIATNKVRKTYLTKFRPDGKPEMNSSGNEVRAWDGKSYERQGFGDQDYLWAVQIRHLYDADKNKWGIRIIKAKADPSAVGLELWGEDCNFESLVQVIYPQVPLAEWGF